MIKKKLELDETLTLKLEEMLNTMVGSGSKVENEGIYNSFASCGGYCHCSCSWYCEYQCSASCMGTQWIGGNGKDCAHKIFGPCPDMNE